MKSLILLSSLLILASCGSSSSSGGDDTNIIQYNSFSTNPIPVTMQYQDCSPTYIFSDNRRFELNLLLNGYYSHRVFDLQNSLSESGRLLQSQDKSIISSTEYGKKEETRYKIEQGSDGEWYPTEVMYRDRILAAFKALLVCPGQKSYDNDKLEGAGISVNYFITKTNKAVKAILPNANIKPVSVKIAPLYSTKYTARRGDQEANIIEYMTDNAFYMPWNRTIQILPQSEEGLKQNVFGGAALWNVPMVISHEYGHHLFAMLYPKSKNTRKKSVHQTHFCFDNRTEEANLFTNSDKTKETQNASRSVTTGTILGALNEGFADLIAYYTLSDEEKSLRNVKCMTENRSVGDKTFYNGQPKEFMDSYLTTFYSSTKKEVRGTCATPNFQDIHIIGAIFATQTDGLLVKANTTKEQKLKVVLKWIQSMNENHSEIEDLPKNLILGKAYSLMIKSIFENSTELSVQNFCLYKDSIEESLRWSGESYGTFLSMSENYCK